MTRIISGTYGGRRLQAPPGDSTRPTTDRVREALFSSLQSEFGGLDGLRFLDLFAGSGAIGLEAASRGAVRVDLVESDRKAAQVISANIAALGARGVSVATTTVERFLGVKPKTSYDAIFLDPPYTFDQAALEQLLAVLGSEDWLAEDGVIVVERSRRGLFDWPDGIEPLRDKKYGETVLWYGH